MRLSCFCACGGSLTGRVALDSSAVVLRDAFEAFHNGLGCQPASREQAALARRRADRAEANFGRISAP